MPIQHRERLLMQKYAENHLLGKRVLYDCRLGSVPQSLIATYGRLQATRIAYQTRPAVDALVIEPDHLLLIEAKIVRWVDGLSKLPLYAAMLPDTPELEEYADRPISMRMVIPFTQENMRSVADRIGVEIVVFTTPEIDEYLTVTLPNYHSGAYKRRRAEILATREKLGVE